MYPYNLYLKTLSSPPPSKRLLFSKTITRGRGYCWGLSCFRPASQKPVSDTDSQQI